MTPRPHARSLLRWLLLLLASPALRLLWLLRRLLLPRLRRLLPLLLPLPLPLRRLPPTFRTTLPSCLQIGVDQAVTT